MAMNFWLAQEKAKRRTLFMVVAFAILTITVALIADSIVTLFWPEYETASLPWIGLGFIFVTCLTALFNYMQFQSQGGAYVAQTLGAYAVNPATPKPVERQLLNIVEEIAVASGLPLPAVYILKNEQINAFAAGTMPENACICVTTGCLNLLNREELQGVIAHEFGHIYNRDVKLSMRLAAMLMGFYLIFYIALKFFQFAPPRDSEGNRGPPAILIAMILAAAGIISWVAGKILSALVSQQREYLADATGVQFTRDPDALVRALKKIEKESKIHEMPKAGMAFSHLYFDNRGYFGSLFSTHPPLEKRIQALLGGKYLPEKDPSEKNSKE